MLGGMLYVSKHYSAVPAHFAYMHGPDGLWAASFIAAISYIWFEQAKPRCGWCIVSIAAMLSFEICQFYGVIAGTGDPVDAVSYLIFSLPIMALGAKIKKTSQ